MEPGLVRDVLTVLLGVVTGTMSGLFGVGGAVISTPGIRALGAPALVAVGTTLPSIIPGATSGTARYVREQLIDWRVVRWAAPPGVVAAIGGSLLSKVVPGEGHLLMLFTAGLLGWSAVRTYRTPARKVQDEHDRSAAPAPPDRISRNVRCGVVGLVAGLLSGLLGVGGGIVMVPGFTQLARMSLKEAIATSLACVAMFSIPGTITHALFGRIDWRLALLLAVGVIPGARLGAALTVRASDQRMRVVVAAFLGATAVLYAAGELMALLG